MADVGHPAAYNRIVRSLTGEREGIACGSDRLLLTWPSAALSRTHANSDEYRLEFGTWLLVRAPSNNTGKRTNSQLEPVPSSAISGTGPVALGVSFNVRRYIV